MKGYASGFQNSIVKYVLQPLSIHYKKINLFSKVNYYFLRRSSNTIIGSLQIIVIYLLWYIETWECLTFYNKCLLVDFTRPLIRLIFHFERNKCLLMRNLKLGFDPSLTHFLARTEKVQKLQNLKHLMES